MHQTRKTAPRELSYGCPLSDSEKPKNGEILNPWISSPIPFSLQFCNEGGNARSEEDREGLSCSNQHSNCEEKVTGLQTQDSIGPRIRIKGDK